MLMRISVGQISARCKNCGCGDFQSLQPASSPAHELVCFSCGASTSRRALLMQIADETVRRAERFIARSRKMRGQVPKP
jgi:hypothetical protein